MAPRVLILPGIHNSGPEHWQSIWEAAHPDYRRVSLGEWGKPRCEDWIQRLDQAVVEVGQDVILVAYSSACALVGHWWIRRRIVIRGALLVAPSDTEASSYPVGPEGFAPMPLCRLPFSTMVVASRNDPQCRSSGLTCLHNRGEVNSLTQAFLATSKKSQASVRGRKVTIC